MYKAAAKLKKHHHKTRLTKGFKSDLQWWHIFVTTWNGVSIITETPTQEPVCCIQTDASGHWGCGAHFDSLWLQHAWSLEWTDISIMAKELVPIIFSCVVWGPLLTRRHVEFYCDNLSLVEAINKGSSKDLMVMHLLRCLWFYLTLLSTSRTFRECRIVQQIYYLETKYPNSYNYIHNHHLHQLLFHLRSYK